MPKAIDMTTTGRHGYAVYSGDIMIAWCISADVAIKAFPGHTVVNVQNGQAFQLD